MAKNHGTWIRQIGETTERVDAASAEEAVRLQFAGWRPQPDPPAPAAEDTAPAGKADTSAPRGSANKPASRK